MLGFRECIHKQATLSRPLRSWSLCVHGLLISKDNFGTFYLSEEFEIKLGSFAVSYFIVLGLGLRWGLVLGYGAACTNNG